MSDGEMEEGKVRDAAMFAAHFELENPTVLLDANDSQVDGPVSEPGH
jgi:transketolase